MKIDQSLIFALKGQPAWCSHTPHMTASLGHQPRCTIHVGYKHKTCTIHVKYKHKQTSMDYPLEKIKKKHFEPRNSSPSW